MAGTNPAMVIKIAADVAGLRASLAQGTSVIQTTTAAMQKLATSFSGDRLIQHAKNVAGAIQHVGGVTKLTAAEMDRANGAIQRAIDKYHALGKQAPADLQNLANATKRADDSTGFLTSTVGKLVAAFSVAGLIDRAVSSLIAWGREAVASAGVIVDLSSKTGLSIETIQRMSFVAQQTSTDLSTFTTAAFNLGVRLSGGGGSVVAAVNELKLSYQNLKAQSPDAQFAAITTALGNMVDPQRRNTLAVELFGKTAKDILPAIEQNYAKLAAAAKVASDEQVQAVDAASDRWTAFYTNTKTTITSFLGTLVMNHDKAKGLDWLFIVGFDVSAAKQGIADISSWWDALRGKLGQPIAPASPIANLVSDPSLQLVKGLPADLDAIEASLMKTSSAQQDAAKHADAHAAALATLSAKFSGAGLLQQAADYVTVVERLGGVSKLTRQEQDDVNRVLSDALLKYQTLGRDAPQAMLDILAKTSALIPVTQSFAGSIQLVQDTLASKPLNIAVDTGQWDASMRRITVDLAARNGEIQAVGTTATATMGTLATSVAGTLGTLGTAVSGAFAQMLLHATSFKDGFVNIWNSIKNSVMNIFTQVLGDFTNRLLKGMLGAMSGQQGAMAGAFTGMIGGATGGGASGGGLISNLVSAGVKTGLGALLGGGAAAVGTSMLAGTAATAGTLGLGATSIGMGIGGGIGAGGGAAGIGGLALSGAATMGIGLAAAGAVMLAMKLLKPSAMEKTNDARDQFFAQFAAANPGTTAAGTGTGSAFGTLAAQLTAATGQAGGGTAFSQLLKAGTVQELQVAIEGVNVVLADAKTKADAAAAAVTAAGTAGAAAAAAEAAAVAKATAVWDAKAVKITTTMSELATQQQGLLDSIKNEKPEAIMGIVEAKTRVEIDAIQQKTDALAIQLAVGTKAAADEIAKTAGAVQPSLDDLTNHGIIPAALAMGEIGTAAENAVLVAQRAFDSLRFPTFPGGTSGTGFHAGGFVFHAGGLVDSVQAMLHRMHSGGLMAGEVPAILQRGEFVISRRGVAATGVGALSQINAGQGGPGTTFGDIVVNINEPSSPARAQEMGFLVADQVIQLLDTNTGGRRRKARKALRIT